MKLVDEHKAFLGAHYKVYLSDFRCHMRAIPIRGEADPLYFIQESAEEHNSHRRVRLHNADSFVPKHKK